MKGLKTWPNTYFERRRPSTDWLLSEKRRLVLSGVVSSLSKKDEHRIAGQPKQRPYRWEPSLAREDCRQEKSRIAPIAVVNKAIPEPPSGTESFSWPLPAALHVRTGRINVAATKAQALPRRLRNLGCVIVTIIEKYFRN